MLPRASGLVPDGLVVHSHSGHLVSRGALEWCELSPVSVRCQDVLLLSQYIMTQGKNKNVLKRRKNRQGKDRLKGRARDYERETMKGKHRHAAIL